MMQAQSFGSDAGSLLRESGGASITLGKELGRGGEGAVHLVSESPDLVAKVYSRTQDTAKAEKLRAMVRHGSAALLGVAAWPVDLVRDAAGELRGFLMPRVGAREDLHELYSPKGRRRKFPDADFRFLVRSATNVARAIAQVHAAGDIIGDINHGNALVAHDATIRLIDCDSFQVREGGRLYTCDVGVALFTAPELQGQPFRGLARDANHDAFGLAVLLFHLLFQGRHPYAGRFEADEQSIETAIAQGRFAYGANAHAMGVSAPPATLPLQTFGEPIAQLFERAFAPPGGPARPTPAEWIDALQALENGLEICAHSKWHFHPAEQACCWCTLEAQWGVQAFGRREDQEDDIPLLAGLWDAIEAVQPPEHDRPMPAVVGCFEALMLENATRSNRRAEAIGTLVAAVMFVPMFWSMEWAVGAITLFFLGLAGLLVYAVFLFLKEKVRFSGTRVRTPAPLEPWNEALRDWVAANKADRFFEAHARLRDARDHFAALGASRAERLTSLAIEHAAAQRNQYLASYPISDDGFVDVSRADVAHLAAEGIRSAADVVRELHRLHQVVRLAAVRELLAWTEARAAGFRFDSSSREHVAAVQALESRISAERDEYIARLRAGPEELDSVSASLDQSRVRAEQKLESLYAEFLSTRRSGRSKLPSAQPP